MSCVLELYWKLKTVLGSGWMVLETEVSCSTLQDQRSGRLASKQQNDMRSNRLYGFVDGNGDGSGCHYGYSGMGDS